MSTVPAFSFAEPGLVNQLPDFQTGFTPWDLECSDLFSVIQSSLEPVVPSPCSGECYAKINTGFHDIKSGCDESCIGSIKTNIGSDDSDSCRGAMSPQSDELDSRIRTNSCDHNRKNLNRPILQMTEERKRKRMESNRESAKRSRKRKQRHIENLKDEMNRLGLENRQLGNRLRIVLYHMEQMSRENNQLFSEQEILRWRFSEMRQILILRQLHSQQKWPHHNRMIMTKQSPSFVIDHQII